MMVCARPERNVAAAGFPIGILALNSRHRLVVGNVQHAGTFPFPVVYEIVSDVSPPAVMRGDPEAVGAIVRGAMKLEAFGVNAIVGACGSFANYQTEVANAVHVPTLLSILLEVPMLLRALPTEQQLGIIFATTASFTARVRQQCGIEAGDRIVAIGADAVSAFQPILSQKGVLDDIALREGIVSLACATVRAHPKIGAWLLQCSDLPPYAEAIWKATDRPVFDMVKLIRHLHGALCGVRVPQWIA